MKYLPWKSLAVLLFALFVLINNNTGPNQFYVIENIKSPYGLGFLQLHGEKAKNFLAENIKISKPRKNPINKENLDAARIAWQYFANNINAKTGLVNTVENHPVTSMWDQASALSALHNARALKLISRTLFDTTLLNMLNSLQNLALVQDRVPHKYYHTRTKKMVRYNGSEGAVGYSPIDIGRLLIWLKVIKEHYPEHAAAIDRIPLSWNYCNLIDGGVMFGGSIDRGGSLTVSQKGRLGYEEYAAKGFYLWGFDTSIASRVLPIKKVNIEGYEIPIDARDFSSPVEKSFVVPDSYLLDGLEFNWDTPDDFHTDQSVHSDTFRAETARRIYLTQQKRFEKTGLPTAKSEYQLLTKPWFVYDTIYANGYAWNTIDDFGQTTPTHSAMTTKAAFAMWALWDTPYTDLIRKSVYSMFDRDDGYSEGMFENGQPIQSKSSNTNAMILASIAHSVYGKSVISDNQRGLWEFALKSKIKQRNNEKCYPLKHVCTENCDSIDEFSNQGVHQLKLKEIKEKIEQLQSNRETKLKAIETVQ